MESTSLKELIDNDSPKTRPADYYPVKFRTERRAECPFSIYQSRCCQDHIPDMIQLLSEMGFAEIMRRGWRDRTIWL
jgi:hypothetical protein